MEKELTTKKQGERKMKKTFNLSRNICLLLVICLGIFTLVLSCSGGGGGGGGTGGTGGSGGTGGGGNIIPKETCPWIAGRWETDEAITITEGADYCFFDSKTITYYIKQDGCDITVTVVSPDNTTSQLSGAVSNDGNITFSGSFTKNGFQVTTVKSMSLNVNGASVTGSLAWDWENNTGSCSGTSTITGSQIYAEAIPGSDRSGEIGAVCESDADCGNTMRCLNSLAYPGITKFCGPSCSDHQDCEGLQDTSYAVFLENNLLDVSMYNSNPLFRGTTCADLAEAPHLVEENPSGMYCVFNCPDNFAMDFKPNGELETCTPLPNFKSVDTGEIYSKGGKDYPIYDSVWDENEECSIFKPCPPLDDDQSCVGGVNSCIVDVDLEGTCFTFKDTQAIEDCVMSCTYDCDSDCINNCYSGSTSQPYLEMCVDRCCNSDDSACN